MIKLSKNEKLALVIFSSFIMMLLPIFLRILNGNLRPMGLNNFILMKSMIESSFWNFTPYMFFLKALQPLFNLELTIKVMPVFLGVINSIIVFVLLTKLNVHRTIRDYSLIIYILSPAFIIGFTIYQELAFVLTLSLAGIYLILNDKRIVNIIGYLCLIPVLFSGIYEGLFMLSMIFIIMRFRFTTEMMEEKLKFALKTIGATFIILNLFIFGNFSNSIAQALQALNHSIIFDFTGRLGLGFFTIVLLVIAFFIMYARTDKYRNELTTFFIVIILLIMNTEKGLVLTLPLTSYLAGFAAAKIINRKWEINNLKYFTAITLIYGIIFSSVSAIVVLSESSPENEIVESLEFLKAQAEGIVLSDNSIYPYIEIISEKDTFDNDINALSIFQNYRRENLELIKESEIEYILITSEMRAELWENEERGLSVLLNDMRNFDKIYSSENIEIYTIYN